MRPKLRRIPAALASQALGCSVVATGQQDGASDYNLRRGNDSSDGRGSRPSTRLSNLIWTWRTR